MKKTTVIALVFVLPLLTPVAIFGATSGEDIHKTRCAACHTQMRDGRRPVVASKLPPRHPTPASHPGNEQRTKAQ